MKDLRGATWWKIFLQTPRSFLNQNVRKTKAGKDQNLTLKILKKKSRLFAVERTNEPGQ